MKTSKNQKYQIQSCIKDLEDYYDTCGTEKDFENLDILKIHIKTIEVIYNIQLIINN